MDIVERLKKWLWAGSPWVDTMGEAASEITRLREENKELEHRLMLATAFGQEEAGAHNEASAEIGRLMGENKVLREAIMVAAIVERRKVALATTGGE